MPRSIPGLAGDAIGQGPAETGERVRAFDIGAKNPIPSGLAYFIDAPDLVTLRFQAKGSFGGGKRRLAQIVEPSAREGLPGRGMLAP